MANKFQHKYRISSARASWWNYGDDGNYFVTINTYNKNHWFGEIVEGVMVLSEVGRIVEECWNEIPKYFPYVLLDSFVVMPNHVHGILIIDKKNYCENEERFAGRDAIHRVSNPTENPIHRVSNPTDRPIPHILNPLQSDYAVLGDAMNRVSTSEPIMNVNIGGIVGQKNPMINQNLSRIIRYYKGKVTFESRKINPLFTWQTRYHEHIIRSNEEYIRISNYICTNVEHWEEDCFYQNGMRM